MEEEKSNLPTLEELVRDVEVYEKKDKLNFLLNQEPPEKWIKEHPFIKAKDDQERSVPYRYLPIDKVEYLLRKIFKDYKIEITGQGQIFNGVYVTVRVHYKDFTTGEWRYHDGIGASQIQTKQGSSPADLSMINNGAVAMAFPAAESYAIKDACDKFGKLFGADISRKDTLNASLMKPKKKEKDLVYYRIETHIENSTSLEQLRQVEGDVKAYPELQETFYLKLSTLQSEKQ